jgi:hypothetical protein
MRVTINSVIAWLKRWVENNGIKPGFKDCWTEVEEIAAKEVNHSRLLVFRP